MRPMIGVSLRQDGDSQYIYTRYLKQIIESGGDYLLLPSFDGLKKEHQETLLIRFAELCDGFLFPGGDHVSDSDLFFLHYALEKKKPILGICLGMQMMASYPEKERLAKIPNDFHQQPELAYGHEVSLNKESRLYHILEKETFQVNTRHQYQVLDGGIFEVVGKSEDGLIEAIESKLHPFQIGVQWHPELMTSYDEDQKKLWKSFLAASRRK